MQSKVCGRRNKALDFSSPFSHPKSGALGKKMSSEIPLEKLSRAEIELRRCLEEDTKAKLLKSECGVILQHSDDAVIGLHFA